MGIREKTIKFAFEDSMLDDEKENKFYEYICLHPNHTAIVFNREIVYNDRIWSKNIDIIRCSINSAKHLCNHPALYCNFPNFRCSVYYPHFQKYLLNSEYCFINYSNLNSWIFEKIGKVFIRPDSGDKRFTGQVCENFYNIHREYEPDNSLLLISEPKDIEGKEVRAFVFNDIVVCNNERIKKYVKTVLDNTKFRPDDFFSIDVLDSDYGNPKIIEINSFSCAGIYDNNPEEIVVAIERSLSNDD